MPKLTKMNDGNLLETGRFRAERGPKLIKATATKELLSDDVTAPHYHLPKKMKTGDGKQQTVYARDAKGKVIREGEDIEYLDWNNPNDFTWYLYRLDTVPLLDAGGNEVRDEETGETQTEERWIEVGTIDGDEKKATERLEKLASSK